MIRYHVYFEMQISYEAKINTRHLPDMANLMGFVAKPRHFQNSPPSIQLLVTLCSAKKIRTSSFYSNSSNIQPFFLTNLSKASRSSCVGFPKDTWICDYLWIVAMGFHHHYSPPTFGRICLLHFFLLHPGQAHPRKSIEN